MKPRSQQWLLFLNFPLGKFLFLEGLELKNLTFSWQQQEQELHQVVELHHQR
jgi:hypothetical protein